MQYRSKMRTWEIEKGNKQQQKQKDSLKSEIKSP